MEITIRKKNRLTVILPVYNRIQYTRKCLEALENQSYKDFRVIVVDDGSTDGTEQMIREFFPDVILLKGDGNLWWTASVNLGIKEAFVRGSDYVMTLNNDTKPAEDFIEQMLKCSTRNPRAVLGALEVNSKTERVSYAGEKINWLTANSELFNVGKKPYNLTGIKAVSHLPGRGLLIPTSVFEEVGLFDENNFPQYAADSDFTHRVKQAGFNVYCNYDAVLYTYPSESGSLKLRNSKSLKKYYEHLFSIKGGGNLKVFWHYAINNCPYKYLVPFLISGFSRRVFGYLIEWIGFKNE
ncbi:glycosyltransferase family 2 protein [Balneolaceae bacterium YR4-1]|uniref:Glycosyltransferase family 2 protein n=1 Tax=Halalkalibaculum roseum TaxID=2709311 RepID=A0A6M1SUX0_9BACT|nr:glycosyltransferase family 2 protein [Halalkalibaculum roseum]NGP75926.1 glycosyltransferase family 2 protein [Halalkalibaculum roseum]